MDAKGRRETVAEAFSVRYPRLIEGDNVLVVDDVFTTGATVSACAAALLTAGAKEVFVLTIARPVKLLNQAGPTELTGRATQRTGRATQRTEPFALETVRKLNLSFSPTFMLGISGSRMKSQPFQWFPSPHNSKHSVCLLVNGMVRG